MIFLLMKTGKKLLSKAAHNRPNFFSNALSCPYGQKLKIHIGNWAEAPSVISTYIYSQYLNKFENSDHSGTDSLTSRFSA